MERGHPLRSIEAVMEVESDRTILVGRVGEGTAFARPFRLPMRSEHTGMHGSYLLAHGPCLCALPVASEAKCPSVQMRNPLFYPPLRAASGGAGAQPVSGCILMLPDVYRTYFLSALESLAGKLRARCPRFHIPLQAGRRQDTRDPHVPHSQPGRWHAVCASCRRVRTFRLRKDPTPCDFEAISGFLTITSSGY